MTLMMCFQIAEVPLIGGMNATLSSQERLDLNVSTTFAELVITTANMWGREGERVLQKARGTYAPYQIRNRTGSPIFIWSDLDGSNNAKDGATVKIANNQTIDWRFDDWKTMREVQSCLYKYIDI
jgi:vacuolar protein sorting-associated protein 13A/C